MPHRESKKPTIAGWVTIALKNAGLNITKFQACSCRSTSSSKKNAMGLSRKSIGDNALVNHLGKNIIRAQKSHNVIPIL